MDRADLTLPNDQDRLIEAVTAANPKTVVVLTTGSAVTTPWASKAPALLEAWYGGTSGGAALARVLFGDVNPSGRLPLSFPQRDADLPTASPAQFPGIDRSTIFPEGLKIGYRHYESAGAPSPAFAFGHGLSYTTFGYSDLTLDSGTFAIGMPGKDATLKGQAAVTATFTVTNTGSRTGATVPQLYVRFPSQAGEPAPLLKGFDKVTLSAGESRRVSIALDQDAFSVFDPDANLWKVVPGTYEVNLGDASNDLRLAQSVTAQVETHGETSVGGTVPATLSLTLGSPVSFGTFTPGADATYDATLAADVISTAGDAALSVTDASTTATGRLVNGTYALAEPLQARANTGALLR